MKTKSKTQNPLRKPLQLACVLTFLFLTTYGCATSLYPVKTSIEKKESIAVFVNLMESKPVSSYRSNLSSASKTITEFDEFFPTFKQMLQKELPSVKIMEPKTTPQEILGQTVYMYDFGKTGAKIGIEFMPVTKITVSNDQDYKSEALTKQGWNLVTAITIRFREINGDRLGNYIGSRLGYELALSTKEGFCEGECPKNANTLIEITSPGKLAPALKAQMPENLKKVIQEIMASKQE